MLAREVERLDTVARCQGGITVRFQQIVEELHVELVVLHNQDGFGHPRFPYSLCRRKLKRRKNHPGGTVEPAKLGPISCGNANRRPCQNRRHIRQKWPKHWRSRRLPSSPKTTAGSAPLLPRPASLRNRCARQRASPTFSPVCWSIFWLRRTC